jgi:hypothetical protein
MHSILVKLDRDKSNWILYDRDTQLFFPAGYITKFICNLEPDCEYSYSRTLNSWHTGVIYFTFLLFLICLISYVIILVFQGTLCYLVVIYISTFSVFLNYSSSEGHSNS